MHGSIWDIFIKKKFKNAWIYLGHFDKNKFFATIKNFSATIKKFSS